MDYSFSFLSSIITLAITATAYHITRLSHCMYKEYKVLNIIFSILFPTIDVIAIMNKSHRPTTRPQQQVFTIIRYEVS